MPAVEYEDRVQETTTTTGTSTLTLAGAVTGFRTFSSTFVNGDRVPYAIAGGSEWELGEGLYSSGTLSRVNVFRSSNANALVNFSAGAKAVWVSISGVVVADVGLVYAMRNALVNS